MNKTIVYGGLLVAIAVLFTLLFVVGCGSGDDTQEGGLDTSDSHGGQTGDDDDTATDDDDTDDDDTDDDDDNVSDLIPYALVVWGDDTQNSQFDTFFTAYEINADYVDEDDVQNWDLTPYDLIIATETTSWWGSPLYNAVENSEKPVLGIYEGGVILFSQLDLNINLGAGEVLYLSRFEAINPDQGIWDNPYDTDLSVTVQQIQVSYDDMPTYYHDMLAMPGQVTSFAERTGADNYSVLSLEDGQYMLWGMSFDLTEYTDSGRALLANVIYYMAGITEL